jgi:polyferredoxin
MVCGWACPFGFVQEILYKIPSRKWGVPRFLRFIKYGVLLFMVLLLPLFAVNEFGIGQPWFCKYLCPAGTLEAGVPMIILQPSLQSTIGWLFYNKLIILIGFIIWSILASRPFCRVACPLGAFYALFSRCRIVKLQHDPVKCTNCKACHKVCPMGVKFNESPEDAECISCLACMNKACRFDAISLSVGGIPLRTVEPVKAKKI